MNRFPTLSARILLVDPEGPQPCPDRSVLDVILERGASICTRVTSHVEALRCLRSGAAIDLVIVVPGASLPTYLSLCRSIKFDVRSAFVPVIFALGPQDPERCVDALEAGVDDCFRLSAPPKEIALRLLKAVRARRATNSLEDANAVITALANAIEGRDTYTCGHVERVATYSMEIGKRVGVDAEGVSTLRRGGVVHDIGKVGIPDHILNKPGKLTEQEMEVVRRHPVIGHDILRPLRTFGDVLPIVRWHHEQPNGNGYPDGLKGDQLPLLPRIVAVADCFDAITTDRPYRPALPPSECKDILACSAENGDLDAQLVATLLTILEEGIASFDDTDEGWGKRERLAVTAAQV